MTVRWLRGRFPAVLLLATGLAAWTGNQALAVSIVTRTGTTPFYTPNVIMAAKQNGELPAVVYGSPSGRADAAAVLAPMRLPASVGGGRFVPASKEQARATRLVLVFNNVDVTPDQACKPAGGIRAGKAEKGLNVYAVLCRGNKFFSHAHLRDDAVSGPRDPRYRQAMEQLLLALMPPEDRPDQVLE